MSCYLRIFSFAFCSVYQSLPATKLLFSFHQGSFFADNHFKVRFEWNYSKISQQIDWSNIITSRPPYWKETIYSEYDIWSWLALDISTETGSCVTFTRNPRLKSTRFHGLELIISKTTPFWSVYTELIKAFFQLFFQELSLHSVCGQSYLDRFALLGPLNSASEYVPVFKSMRFLRFQPSTLNSSCRIALDR